MINRSIKAKQLKSQLAKIPRLNFCDTPSPVERWSNLENKWELDHELYVKRDDLIGVAYGGNKSRQLEFLLADANNNNCDVIVHGGALQSNYCRQLTAAANSLNLETHLVLSTHYNQQPNTGNHLLMKLLGANIHYFEGPLGNDHEFTKKELTNFLKSSGRNPYLITYPESEILGGLGYVNAAIEIFEQIGYLSKVERIVMPAVGASYAGLLLGLQYLGLTELEIVGVAPLKNEYRIEETILESIKQMINVLGLDFTVDFSNKINIIFNFAGNGYAQISQNNISALLDVAKFQGVLLDPVYTSKAFSALKHLSSSKKNTLFWHTGGSPAIFSYADEILKYQN